MHSSRMVMNCHDIYYPKCCSKYVLVTSSIIHIFQYLDHMINVWKGATFTELTYAHHLGNQTSICVVPLTGSA